MLQTLARTAYDEDHHAFRDQVRRFFERELTPNLQRWEEAGIVDREFWRTCGEAGLLCPTAPEAHGGLGLNFGYNAVIDEELAYAGSTAPRSGGRLDGLANLNRVLPAAPSPPQ